MLDRGLGDETDAASAGPFVLPRQRVDALLAGAWTHPLTLLTADGGYGKTTALQTLVKSGSASGRKPLLKLRPADREVENLAARIGEALGIGAAPGLAVPSAAIGAEDRTGLARSQAGVLTENIERMGGQFLLVLDDLDRLTDSDASVELLRSFCLEAPPNLHLVLSGRRVPALGLGADVNDILELTALDLAFTADETTELVGARLGPQALPLAGTVSTLTGGWPAAVNLVVGQLERTPHADRERALSGLGVLAGQSWNEFVADLLAREPRATSLIIELAAIAPKLDVELLRALGISEPKRQLQRLRNVGMLIAALPDDESETGRMSRVLSETVRAQLPADRASELRDSVATWLESADRLDEALECRRHGPADQARAMLARCGEALVTAGGGARVAQVLKSVGTGGRPDLEWVLGEAFQSIGDWDGALASFEQAQRASANGRLHAAVAWRFGALLYLRGDSDAALTLLGASHAEAGEATADDALVTAWLASTLWSRGDASTAEQMAALALAQSRAHDDAAAMAVAHVASALTAASRGDREQNERHYRAALRYASEAGDSVQLARIHANLSSRAVEEGSYRLAIEEADQALSVGAGHQFFAALAMCNKAEALIRLGDLDDARATLAEAIDAYAELGSLVICTPHTLLGMIYRERGDLTRARLSFELGLRMAEQAEDVHTLVFALCGLAQTIADEDVASARALISRAMGIASSLERAHALCAAAAVELMGRDYETAIKLADEAEAEARSTGDRPALAEALALGAIAAQPAREDRLSAATELFEEIGNVIASRRIELVLATIRGDSGAAARLTRALTARGVSPSLGPFERVLQVQAAETGQQLTITTLGKFTVTVNGVRLPTSAWQSRKARDLLKLLVASRGRVLTRDAAAEILWPNEGAGPLSNRLSVALSTLRRVLDPGRAAEPDYFIGSDRQALSLRADRVRVDVIDFLAGVRRGMDLASSGDLAGAEQSLRDAEQLYAGDFLEEDLYEDWTVDCRETVRSAAMDSSRLLARAAFERGDNDEVCRHLRRLLERDSLDEEAWISLIGALSRLGRHGEARRQHAIYAQRMQQLGVAPMPLAQTLGGRP